MTAARPFSRDPSGYVFFEGDRVYRAVDDERAATLAELNRDGTLAELNERRLLVPTSFVSDPDRLAAFQQRNPAFRAFLEHERVSPISYPYEWSVSMLADAGTLTLDLQLRLLERGYGLKDASAFNVQFPGGRPVLIDVASLERVPRRDQWFALGQFNRMFTFPLLLVRHRGWDLRSYFLANPDGRSERDVARAWGTVGRLDPRLLLDVTLPALLAGSRPQDRKPTASGNPNTDAQAADSSAQSVNLRRLARKISRLAQGYRPGGPWATYDPGASYTSGGDTAKRELVSAYLSSVRPVRVVDVGCNTGDYSLIAERAGARVVALDSDHDAIEVLYRRLRGTQSTIVPLVADVANPSPACGYGGTERSRLADRVRGDCVIALAVLHHLLVTGLRLEHVRDTLLDLTSDHLVLEFVPRSDPMFERLMSTRRELAEEPSLERCMEVFAERFELVRREPLQESGRSLLCYRRR